ncbi:hypothetical protein GWG54_20150 [Natronococcus sp. JC468]|uniref:hypothetical protein n=1 Tax=Natronococcus sp. JC468 TaxID=1961921 RepID=UPI0014398EF8|nr:hypothetical protein [Natronococcus sp. JC468]NKE38059.1 hypothetical protein [Natronococcus sp. JC468]
MAGVPELESPNGNVELLSRNEALAGVVEREAVRRPSLIVAFLGAPLGLSFRSPDFFALPDVVTRGHSSLDSEVIVGRIHKATFDRMEVDTALI